MLEERYRMTAPELWTFILGRNFIGPHPIVRLQGAHYVPALHGSQSHDVPLADGAGYLVNLDFSRGQLPRAKRERAPRRRMQRTDPIFAIASPFDVWTGRDFDPRTRGSKTKTREFFGSHRLTDLRKERKLWPYAMVTADFDCPNTRENLIRIGQALNSGQNRYRWILDSGNSFHLVEEELFNPKYYPLYIGQLILDFADTAPEFRRHIIRAYGQDLTASWKDFDRLERWSAEVLRIFKHYDDPGKDGLTFILDMRHLAHSLHEWLLFMKTGTGGFGYLRIIGKRPGEKPPHVVIMKWPYCNSQFDLSGYKVRQRQEKLL